MKTERAFLIEDGEDVTILPYEPKQRGRTSKFLYLKNEDIEVLIVTNSPMEHRYLLDYYNHMNPDKLVDKADLRGAGRTLLNEIGSWYSAGFDFDTPEELKPRILELLGLLA